MMKGRWIWLVAALAWLSWIAYATNWHLGRDMQTQAVEIDVYLARVQGVSLWLAQPSGEPARYVPSLPLTTNPLVQNDGAGVWQAAAQCFVTHPVEGIEYQPHSATSPERLVVDNLTRARLLAAAPLSETGFVFRNAAEAGSLEAAGCVNRVYKNRVEDRGRYASELTRQAYLQRAALAFGPPVALAMLMWLGLLGLHYWRAARQPQAASSLKSPG